MSSSETECSAEGWGVSGVDAWHGLGGSVSELGWCDARCFVDEGIGCYYKSVSTGESRRRAMRGCMLLDIRLSGLADGRLWSNRKSVGQPQRSALLQHVMVGLC